MLIWASLTTIFTLKKIGPAGLCGWWDQNVLQFPDESFIHFAVLLGLLAVRVVQKHIKKI